MIRVRRRGEAEVARCAEVFCGAVEVDRLRAVVGHGRLPNTRPSLTLRATASIDLSAT